MELIMNNYHNKGTMPGTKRVKQRMNNKGTVPGTKGKTNKEQQGDIAWNQGWNK